MLDKIYTLLKLSYREIWAVEKLFEYVGNLFSTFSIKGFLSTLLAIFEILQMLIFGMPLTPRGEVLDLTGYSIVVYDEFNGEALDTDVWEYRGNGPRRGGFNASSQVEVRDGNLIIAGEYLPDGEYGEGWYTAAIKLKERYKHGYFEIKCKVNDSPAIGAHSGFRQTVPIRHQSQRAVPAAQSLIFSNQNAMTKRMTNTASLTPFIAQALTAYRKASSPQCSAVFTATILPTNTTPTVLSGQRKNIFSM